ncbi:MAG: NAD synthetase / Glutamine amidotransferase chain of NAD synthetase [Ktedonobacterales bacterium]|jgi:NAD+ synthase (glutamine-hydrolysing)|nr:MAG: NAD synthetase / Glutamine amidotransferase chain of NAD synthetase [Ktedonobacterales bacterium]
MIAETQASVGGARPLRLALAQINVTVGDLMGNVERMIHAMRQAAESGSNLVAFPELALPGYPPEDLLLKPGFVADNLRALEHLTHATREFPGLAVVVGFADRTNDLYNAAAILFEGEARGIYHKHYLPNYGVFDEDRYFAAGVHSPCYIIGGVTVGINICEDIWYPTGPATEQAYAGAELLINISASPFFIGKQAARERMLSTRAADTGSIVAYLNLVGGQDELIFDGSSVVFDEEGELIARAKAFEEDLLIVDLDIADVFRTRLHGPRRRKERLAAHDRTAQPLFISGISTQPELHPDVSTLDALQPRLGRTSRIEPLPGRAEEGYRALVLGTRDYVRKNGFRDAVIGLSGGIDSALTATIAVDALGKEHVWGISMPSRYSSEGSKDDARDLAENLDIRYLTLPIEEPFAAYLKVLEPAFDSGEPATSTLPEENIQARIRGNLLMALSNRFGSILLTTGNKSEMAVGYATLYGDMAGGFAVLKDVFKTFVYELARWRNAHAGMPLIPESTITKPPSAELRPGQQDTDSLPPYDILDPILRAYVEEDRTFEEMVTLGFAPETIQRVMNLVDMSEYKRRQAPPGIKVTGRAFGRDRRLPLTSAYRGQPATYPFAPEDEKRQRDVTAIYSSP